VTTHVSQDDISFVGRIHVWEIECYGNSIYLRVITKYLSQENHKILDINSCVDWVTFFKGEASSCLLSTGRFGFRLRVSTEDFVVQVFYIYQKKSSWYNLLHTFESKLSFSALLWWRKMVFSS